MSCSKLHGKGQYLPLLVQLISYHTANTSFDKIGESVQSILVIDANDHYFFRILSTFDITR